MTRSIATGAKAVVILICCWATTTFAETWTCNQAGLSRDVLVYYPEPPATLPCEVYYGKPDENVMPQVLWKAANTEGYCMQKANEFVAKLESLGWSCELEADAQ